MQPLPVGESFDDVDGNIDVIVICFELESTFHVGQFKDDPESESESSSNRVWLSSCFFLVDEGLSLGLEIDENDPNDGENDVKEFVKEDKDDDVDSVMM